MLWGAAWTETGLVFTHEDGRAVSPNVVFQRFDRLGRHDMPPIRLHDLRHVAATLALTAGVDIKVVSEQLGHHHPDHPRHLPQRHAAGRAGRRPGRRGAGAEGREDA